MKKKFNKKIKRIKKIIAKIIKDKQLLTIFSLLIKVFIVGCIAIGFLRTFIILISIILIAFAVTTINSTSGTTDSVEQTMNAAEVTMFNNKFTPYLGTNKSITEAKALINIVIAHNALQKTETEKVR